MYKAADILFFTRYTFNDSGHEAPHFGLVIVPSKLTQFKESILCAVMTSQPVRNKYGTHLLSEADYAPLTKDTTIRLRDFDYVHHTGLDSSLDQPLCRLNATDTKACFKILKDLLFGRSSPLGNADPYLRATIIREWKEARTTAQV